MSTAGQKAAKGAAAQRTSFQWDDPLLFDDQLSEDERLIRDSARGYAQDKLMPRVIDAYMQENTDRWKQLCAEASVEQDPQRLLELTRQINDLLLGKQRRLDRPNDPPVVQNEK